MKVIAQRLRMIGGRHHKTGKCNCRRLESVIVVIHVNIAKDTSNMIVQPDSAFFEIKNDRLDVYSRVEDSVFFTPEKDISFAKEGKTL